MARLFLILVGFCSIQIHAAQGFDYEAFTGAFEADLSDPRNQACNRDFPIRILRSHPAESSLEIENNTGGVEVIKYINQGKRSFNSCYSNGLMGYTDIVGRQRLLTRTIVYLEPGFFCQWGVREQYRLLDEWEIRGDYLVEIYGRKNECWYKRLP